MSEKFVAIRYCRRDAIPADDIQKAVGEVYYADGQTGYERWQGNLHKALVFRAGEAPDVGWPWNYGGQHSGTLKEILQGTEKDRTRLWGIEPL